MRSHARTEAAMLLHPLFTSPSTYELIMRHRIARQELDDATDATCDEASAAEFDARAELVAYLKHKLHLSDVGLSMLAEALS